MSVIFTQEVQDYLDGLVPVLHRKGYFGFEESAVKYVKELTLDIVAYLPIKPHRPVPKYFYRYGTFYAKFRKNRKTTWYVFFTRYDRGDDVVYIVRHIINNHLIAHLL